MSFFDTKTRVVPIDADNTVTIRALTYGEEQDAKSRAMRISAKVTGKKGKNSEDAEAEGEAVIDASLMQRLTLYKIIVAWDGPGFDGRPITIANIDALPTAVLDPVIEAYNELAKPLDDDEKKA